MTDTLTPEWMSRLSTLEQAALVRWLNMHGVNPNNCALVYFNSEDHKFHAKMYATDTFGRAEIRDGEVQYAEDIVFSPTYVPESVVERLGTAQLKGSAYVRNPGTA